MASAPVVGILTVGSGAVADKASGQHERLHQQAGQKTVPDPIVKNVKSPLAPREPSTEDIRQGLDSVGDRSLSLATCIHFSQLSHELLGPEIF